MYEELLTLAKPECIMTKQFTCDVCSKEFYSKILFHIHSITHLIEDTFDCEACQLGFSHILNLDDHLEVHKICEIFVCHVCTKEFFDKNTFNKHLRRHSNESINLTSKKFIIEKKIEEKASTICPVSTSVFETILDGNFQDEIGSTELAGTYFDRTSNEDSATLSVSASDKFNIEPERQFGESNNSSSSIFSDNNDTIFNGNAYDEISNSQISNSGDIQFATEFPKSDGNKAKLLCKFCDKKFMEKTLLDAHILTHKNEESKKNYPPELRKNTSDGTETYSSEVLYNENQKTSEKALSHKPQPEQATFNDKLSFSCSVCHLKFSEKNALDDHLETHNIKTIFVCAVCQKPFFDSSALDDHLQLHKIETIFICNVCQEKFTEKSALDKHIILHDSKNLIVNQQIFTEKHVNEDENGNNDSASDVLNEISNESLNDLRNKSQLFSCEYCPDTFAKKSELKKHSHVHKNYKEIFSCGYCKKQYPKRCLVKNHIMNAHSERKLPCEICEKKFRTKNSLMEHMKTHDKTHTCEVCQKKFSSKNQLFNHIYVHAIVWCFECDVCQLTFSEKTELEKHSLTHKKPIECEICHKTFRSKRILREHAVVHNDEKPYVCNICEKRYRRKSTLYVHRRYHTGEKRFVCEMCEKAFNSKGKLNQHHNTHTGAKPYSCGICQQRFSFRSNMRRHRFAHSGEKPFLCNVCGKSFSNASYLKFHLAMVHSQIKKEQCEVCGKCFLYRSRLLSHLRQHTGEKPFLCETCGKSFMTKALLTIHMRGHLGLPRKYPSRSLSKSQTAKTEPGVKFICEVCNKEVTSKTILKQHYLRMHYTGEKPLVCNICGKGFFEKSKFNYHVHSHSGEKPVSCEYCGKMFANKYNMQIHVKCLHLKTMPVRIRKKKNASGQLK